MPAECGSGDRLARQWQTAEDGVRAVDEIMDMNSVGGGGCEKGGVVGQRKRVDGGLVGCKRLDDLWRGCTFQNVHFVVGAEDERVLVLCYCIREAEAVVNVLDRARGRGVSPNIGSRQKVKRAVVRRPDAANVWLDIL